MHPRDPVVTGGCSRSQTADAADATLVVCSVQARRRGCDCELPLERISAAPGLGVLGKVRQTFVIVTT